MRGIMASRSKHADPRPVPRLYLLTPRLPETEGFVASLAEALEAGDVAAVLLRLADADERTLINRAKALVPITQAQNAALLLDGHTDLVARAGADGVHLSGLTDFAEAMERMKPERIVGVGGLATRHDAMLVAEQGVDYLMFGAPEPAGSQPSFAAVEEQVAWWAEIFETPCVGYAAGLDEIAPLVDSGADFVALGDWLWSAPAGIAATLRAAAAYLRLPDMPEAIG
jgi:thiamine-phosphate pyrophosphorylase